MCYKHCYVCDTKEHFFKIYQAVRVVLSHAFTYIALITFINKCHCPMTDFVKVYQIGSITLMGRKYIHKEFRLSYDSERYASESYHYVLIKYVQYKITLSSDIGMRDMMIVMIWSRVSQDKWLRKRYRKL